MVGTMLVAVGLLAGQSAPAPAAPAVPWANKLFLPGIADNPTQPPPPVLAHSFGAVPRGTVCVHTFTLTNIYQFPLQIARTSREAVGLEPYPPQRLLQPFETADFPVTLDTRTLPAGKSVHNLTAVVVAGGTGVEHHSPAYFRFEVTVRPDVALTPGDLALGSVPFGQRKAAAVILDYTGRQPGWKITAANADGPYTVRLEEAGGNKYRLTAELLPTAGVGRVGGFVSLVTNDPTLPVVQVPVSGTVLAAVTAVPEVVQLRRVKVGEKDELRVMVRGGTNRPFQIKPVADPGDGVSVETFGFPVATQQVIVRFEPSKPGVVRKQVRLETDLPGNPAVVLTVEAEGV